MYIIRLLLLCVCLSVLTSCEQQSINREDELPFLHVHALPKQAPKELQRKLAWGLLNLDQPVIKAALDAKAQPYILAHVVDGLPPIACDKKLSPYALLLGGYLHAVEGKEDFEDCTSSIRRGERMHRTSDQA